MAELKTYIISVDIASGQCAAGKLHSEISDSGYITGFDGVIIDGDSLKVLGASINNEVSLDALVLAHDGVSPIDSNWYPTAITLGDTVSSGATLQLSSGAGYYYNFDATSNDEVLINIGLERDGSSYDGSNLQLELDWMLYGTVSANNNVKWELDYAFIETGDNSYTKKDGTVNNLIDVTGRTQQLMYTDSLPTVSGAAGSRNLQLTLRRLSSGPGADAYGGGAEIYGIQLIKL